LSAGSRAVARANVHDGRVDALELIVDEGRHANAGRFFQLGADLLALLDELSEVPVAWRVADLRMSSAVARVAPPVSGPTDDRWLRLAVNSLEAVEHGSGLSDVWSPDAIKVAHRFVEHGQPSEGEQDWTPPRLRLVTDEPGGDRSVSLTPELGGRLADLQPFERRMPGSVRGTLVGLNVSRGNRASLRLPNKRIVRIAFDTSLRGDLKEAMYQPVELHGDVRQDGDGRVFHLRAESVNILTKPDVRWSDLFGMDPDFTGGSPVDQWLEANRGEA
jgi:hypothetical protein